MAYHFCFLHLLPQHLNSHLIGVRQRFLSTRKNKNAQRFEIGGLIS